MDTNLLIKRTWSKEDTYALIEMYEQFPELWNVKSKIYRDRIKKEKAFKEIADKFGASINEIQRKLHNLRTQQNQEVKKVKKKKTGDGADDVYKSSWEYFDALKFLINDSSVEQGEDNLEGQNSDTNQANEVMPIEPSTSSNSEKRVKQKKLKYDDEAIMKKAMDELNKPSDEFQIFGDFVASELRSLKSAEHQRQLKRIIQKAILDISSIDDNVRCESRESIQSQTSHQSSHSHTSSYHQSALPQASPPYMQAQTSSQYMDSQATYYSNASLSNSTYSTSHNAELQSQPHNIQELSLRSYIQGYETDT